MFVNRGLNDLSIHESRNTRGGRKVKQRNFKAGTLTKESAPTAGKRSNEVCN